MRKKGKAYYVIFFGALLLFLGIVATLVFSVFREGTETNKESTEKTEPAEKEATQNNKSQKPKDSQQDRMSAPARDDMIQVSFPKRGERVGGDIYVTGIARGAWYFEGDFPVRILDEAGNELISAPASAQGEWMTEELVPFVAHIKYPVSETVKATIVLEKDNPSGLAENADQIEIPVVLRPNASSAKIFLSNQHFNRNESYCDQVFPVGRSIPESMAYAQIALEELLRGPNKTEMELGYGTAIPNRTKIQNFDASTNVARVDLSEELLNIEADTECSRTFIQAQITETIKGASGAEEVVITVDGQPFPGEFPDEGPQGE